MLISQCSFMALSFISCKADSGMAGIESGMVLMFALAQLLREGRRSIIVWCFKMF